VFAADEIVSLGDMRRLRSFGLGNEGGRDDWDNVLTVAPVEAVVNTPFYVRFVAS